MRRLIWLIPPLLGVAAYLSGPRGGPATGEKSAPAATTAAGHDRTTPEGRSAYASMEDLQKALDRAAAEEHRALMARSPAELREIMLRLQKAIALSKEDDRWPDPDWGKFLEDAGGQLGRLEKAEAVRWTREHCRDQAFAAMDGWAEVDAEGAYAALVRTDACDVCSVSTAMNLLQKFGEQSTALMKERAGALPWDRMNWHENPMLPPEHMAVPETASARPWIESGTAVDLCRLGLDTRNLLNRWARESPDEALAMWLDGKELPAKDRGQALSDMLYPPEHEKADQPRLQAALDRLSPEDRERVSQELTRFAEKAETTGEWSFLYPALVHRPPPAAEEGGGE